MLKCAGCLYLIREAQDPEKINPKFPLVIYGCEEERLPYWTSINGLMRPGKGNQRAADNCSKNVTCGCVVCGAHEKLLSYGKDDFVYICPNHDKAWGKWLDDHPGKREYIHPRKTIITSHWIEVFWKFVAEARAHPKL